MIFHTLILALSSASPPPVPASPSQISWFQGPHMSALGKARSESRLLMVYFWMDGSDQCKRMFGETLSSEEVGSEFENLVCQGIDIATAQGAKLVQQYGVVTLPTMLFINPAGEREDAVLGFIDDQSLIAEMARIRAGSGTVSDFKKQIERTPDDLALIHRFAVKLREIGDQSGHDELVAKIRAKDPEGRTLTGARLAFWEVRSAALANTLPAEVDLSALRLHAESILVREIRFEAWSWIAGFEYEREARPGARAAFRRAYENVAAGDVVNFGMQLARAFWMMRDELDGKDKSFLLEVGRAAVEAARKLGEVEGAFDPTQVDAETYGEWLSFVLDAGAMAEYVNGNRRQAIQLVEEAIELFPDGEEFAGRLELFRDGR